MSARVVQLRTVISNGHVRGVMSMRSDITSSTQYGTKEILPMYTHQVSEYATTFTVRDGFFTRREGNRGKKDEIQEGRF